MKSLSTYKNLKLLWWLRNIAISGQVIAIMAVTKLLDIPLPEVWLWSIIAGSATLNLLTWWRLRTADTIPDREFFVQLFLDMLALFGLLYLTGGATNPFASLFILQVVIAAITLPALYTWVIAGLTIAFYTLLMFYNMKVPYFQHHHIGDFFNLHVQGMWISFILLAGIVAWFVVRMNATIHRQEALLAEAEKMAALGALATGAAHELGTPLATMAILAEDIPAKKAKQFAEQISRCKQILSRITATGGVMRAEGGAPMQLHSFLEHMLKDWRKERPEVVLETKLRGQENIRIVAEQGFKQALLNVLNNAADASPHHVRLEAEWNTQQLHIRIHDEGEGVAETIKDSLGKIGATTKPEGLGLGLFLAMSVIQRLEGILTLENKTEGGAVATLSLPLRRLAV